MFADRSDAGRQLARELAEFRGSPQAIVLGIPRGGVVVAAEVARELELPLDIAVAAKVGSPANPEYAIGAVAPDGEVSPNPTAGFSATQVSRLGGPAFEKVRRYLEELRGDAEPPDIEGKTVLLVDDGLATGLTALAAADWLKRQKAARVVVAVPVASSGSVQLMEGHADEVRAVQIPENFYAVGQFYERFGQTEDSEVERILSARERAAEVRRR
jgi:putative phosphoribosyl transferase